MSDERFWPVTCDPGVEPARADLPAGIPGPLWMAALLVCACFWGALIAWVQW